MRLSGRRLCLCGRQGRAGAVLAALQFRQCVAAAALRAGDGQGGVAGHEVRHPGAGVGGIAVIATAAFGGAVSMVTDWLAMLAPTLPAASTIRAL